MLAGGGEDQVGGAIVLGHGIPPDVLVHRHVVVRAEGVDLGGHLEMIEPAGPGARDLEPVRGDLAEPRPQVAGGEGRPADIARADGVDAQR